MQLFLSHNEIKRIIELGLQDSDCPLQVQRHYLPGDKSKRAPALNVTGVTASYEKNFFVVTLEGNPALLETTT